MWASEVQTPSFALHPTAVDMLNFQVLKRRDWRATLVLNWVLIYTNIFFVIYFYVGTLRLLQLAYQKKRKKKQAKPFPSVSEGSSSPSHEPSTHTTAVPKTLFPWDRALDVDKFDACLATTITPAAEPPTRQINRRQKHHMQSKVCQKRLAAALKTNKQTSEQTNWSEISFGPVISRSETNRFHSILVLEFCFLFYLSKFDLTCESICVWEKECDKPRERVIEQRERERDAWMPKQTEVRKQLRLGKRDKRRKEVRKNETRDQVIKNREDLGPLSVVAQTRSNEVNRKNKR